MISQYKKCWEVSWCLGWNITEWNVDEITFDCTTGDIIKLKCSKPYKVKYSIKIVLVKMYFSMNIKSVYRL